MKHLRVFHSVFQLDPGLLLLFGLKQLYLVKRGAFSKGYQRFYQLLRRICLYNSFDSFHLLSFFVRLVHKKLLLAGSQPSSSKQER